MNPRISVLFAVFNGEKYLKEAVESILNQTFKEFELIVINDGSTDRTEDLLGNIKDSRVIILKNDKNIGLPGSLNKGLAIAKGEYIARMDADDISVIDRFEKQIAFLDTHKEVGVLGTAMKHIDAKGKEIAVRMFPERHPYILWIMFFDTAIAHATVMMRKEILVKVGGYRADFLHCEDTELWARIIKEVKFANLPEALYIRRLHYGSIMSKHSKVQLERTIEVRKELFKHFLKKEISPEVLTWLVYGETYSLAMEEAQKGIALVKELYLILLPTFKADFQMKKEIEDDMQKRIESLVRAHKHKVIKFFARIGKRILPLSLAHRIKNSFAGRSFFN